MAVEERETTTEEEAVPALSVSAAMGLAKNALEEVVVRLVGEVSEVNDKPGYKAVYFTVKDEKASLPCMMWMNRYQASGVALSVGALVELTGRFSLYAAKGRMNFDVFSVSLAGEGQLRLQVANLARELEAMGLMDPARKRPLPAYPETIGLVTSPRGAAVHDVLRTLRRRYPLARILFAGVPVEGPGAADGLVDGLAKVVFAGAEVVLLVRGGGSFEDLMPFNDRRLARTIAACPVPVVTGIGHEPDTSIADMVADVRASTPTAAAEAVAPAQSEITARIQGLGAAMGHAEGRRLDGLSLAVERLASLPLFREPTRLFDAEALALALGISNITVPICEPFEAFEAVLARACGGALTGLAAENTQARCRMVCLMALSNAHGWLMLNTGNKSEAAMGYSTLYGDTAGAFAPLGGVYKTDVFAMARWRNRRAVEEGGTGPIPVNVFVKPPSAELAPDQEDEKSLGVDYATLDRILVSYVEEGKDAAAIAEDGFSRDLVDYVIARTDANAFKRALEPPYPDAPFYGDPASR